jgi:vacuolar protein sorting-associated protein 53
VRGSISPLIFTANALTGSLSFSSDPGRRSTDRRSTEGRVNIQELKTACLVLNTADYCRTTAAQVCPGGLPRPFVTMILTPLFFQLEEMTQEKIVSELKDQVSFDNERTIFISSVFFSFPSLLLLCSSTDK